jgi:hypothetical protein
MDQLNSRVKQITNELKQYVETRLDLLVLNVGEQVTKWLGESIQKLIGFTVLGIGSFFGLMALAIYLGELLENPALGYLIVALPMILIGLLLASAKPKGIAKSIQNQFMDGILKSIEKKDQESIEQLPAKKPKALTQGNEQKD